LHEGIEANKVFIVGNTVVDAVYQNLEMAKSKSKALEILGAEAGKFILATAHRAENVDDKSRFSGLINGLQKVQAEFGLPVFYPIHPRAKKQLETFNLDTHGISLIEPLDYLGFLQLESLARLVLSDSGGVQEETCVLGVPCVTLRDNTERPETLDVGSNILAGTDPDRILAAAKVSIGKKNSWVNPFGDGKTAQKILNILKNELA
jgi:UDP-N-acetylglucosamine 2-epimerase (non-hydrolysing)